jgi:predicted dehydrogenase
VAASVFSNRAAEQHAIEVFGERGRLAASLYRADGLRFVPSGSFAGAWSRRIRDALAPLAALPTALAERRLGGVYLAAYRGLWEAFARCLLDGAPAEPTIDDGTRSLEIALAAIRSADERRAVRIAPRAPAGRG